MAVRQDEWTRRALLRAGASVPMLGGVLSACAPDEPADDEAPTDDTDDTDPEGVVTDDTDAGVDTDETDLPLPDDTVTWDAEAIPPDDTFDHAVQAGGVTRTEAVLLSHAPGLDRVLVRVWEVVTAPDVVRLFVDELATPVDGFVRVELEGLPEDTVLRYGFFRVDEDDNPVGRSDLGRFRTAPADDAEPVFTVAVLSCNGDATGRNDAIGRVADQPDVDAIVHLGDMAYNDGANTLAQYRSSWASWLRSPGYRAGLSSAGLYATWDDHEVDNNWDAEEVSPAQRAAALQSFLEHAAVRAGEDGRLWRSYRWGATAELFVLDCRGERQASTRRGSDDDIYLSRAQMDWLKAGLASSPCRFKIVLNSVPITNMPNVWDVAANDRWEGYPKQRDELLFHIRDQDIADVWFLAGDFHVCFTSLVQPSGVGRLGQTREIAVTSGNSNPLGLALTQSWFGYNTSSPRLCLCTFDPAAGTVRVRFIDPANGQAVFDRTLSQTP